MLDGILSQVTTNLRTAPVLSLASCLDSLKAQL
jgi:hypothetical protein